MKDEKKQFASYRQTFLKLRLAANEFNKLDYSNA